MAVVVADLEARASYRDAGAEAGLGRLNNAVGQTPGFFRSAASAATGFIVAMGAMRAVGAAWNFAKDAIIGFNSLMEQSTIGFATMLGSGRKAEEFLKGLQDFAAKTPFRFEGLVQSSQRLLAMGFAADEIKPLLTSVGDAMAALGQGDAGIDRATYALGQMRASARVGAQDMMQLTSLGIPAWDILAKHAGKTVAETRKMAEEGRIDAEEAITALSAGMNERFGGLMARQATTFAGAWSTILDTSQILIAKVFEPLFQAASTALQGLAAWLTSPAAEQFGAAVTAGAERAFDAIGRFVGIVREAIDMVARLVAPLVGPARAALESLGTSVGQLGEAFGRIFDVVMAGSVERFRAIMDAALQALAPTITWFSQTILPTITQWAQSVVDWFNANWQTIGAAINTVLNIASFIIQGFIATLGLLLSAVQDVWPAIQVVIETVVGVIAGLIEAFLAILAGDWGKAWDAIKGVFVTIWDGIVKFIGTIPRLILGILKGLAVAAMIWIGGLAAGLVKGAAGLVSNVVGQAAQLPGRFMGAIGSLLGQTGRFIGDLAASAVRGVVTLVRHVATEAGKMPGRFVDGIRMLIPMLLNFLRSIPGRILAAVTDLGKAIVSGIWTGITGLAGWLWDKVTGFVRDIVGNVAGFLGISSPSKVFAEIGANMVRGLAVGVEERAGEAVKAMQRTAAGMTAGAVGRFAVTGESTANVLHRVAAGAAAPAFAPATAGPTIIMQIERFVGREDEARYYSDLMARTIRLQGA